MKKFYVKRQGRSRTVECEILKRKSPKVIIQVQYLLSKYRFCFVQQLTRGYPVSSRQIMTSFQRDLKRSETPPVYYQLLCNHPFSLKHPDSFIARSTCLGYIPRLFPLPHQTHSLSKQHSFPAHLIFLTLSSFYSIFVLSSFISEITLLPFCYTVTQDHLFSQRALVSLRTQPTPSLKPP